MRCGEVRARRDGRVARSGALPAVLRIGGVVQRPNPCLVATASLTALAPSPMKSENPFAAELTPAKLCAEEPVRQRGAGAC
jgi:hypothetical protein